MKKQWLVAACLFYAASAQARIYLRPMGYYSSYKTTSDDDSGPSYSSSRILYDMGIGYLHEKGWMLGAMYQSDGGGAEYPGNVSYGPSLGWVSQKDVAPYVVAHYFFKSGIGASSTSSETERSWGYQADFGFKAPLSRVTFAFQISYKHYSHGTIGGSFTRVDPLIGLFMSL
jgi:hypothetical protein